jgi:CBS domain-containing protein
MKVKDALHKGAFWVGPDTSITEIAKLMQKNEIGAVPIGENDRLIGMVTDRDIVCKGVSERHLRRSPRDGARRDDVRCSLLWRGR